MSFSHADRHRSTRRRFLGQTALGVAASCLVHHPHLANVFAAEREAGKLAFQAASGSFSFSTGVLQGTLRGEGKSRGLLPAVHVPTAKNLAKSLGLFSHYRLLDDANRYGTAGWDWASTATLRDDGSISVAWTRDDMHPFDMLATYRFAAPDTLDLTTEVRSAKSLRHMEAFLACYFDGFSRAFAYAKAGGKPGLIESLQAEGMWHMYPRDASAVDIIQDGRWKLPPNPVEWTIRPELAGALAVRRDESGLTALIMARPTDCFAIAMPYGEETHRSIYLSLIGRDLREGESAIAKTRLVIRPDISDADAIAEYEQFVSSARD